MKIIEIKNLRKRYGNRDLYSKVNLSFEDRGFYAIVGESGSGKTSLLEIIGGIDADYLGNVYVFGNNITLMSEEERSSFRLSKIGYLRQQFDLLGDESSLFNVLLPLKSKNDDPKRIQNRKAEDLLSFVDIKNKRDRKCKKMSGGEKQRVALSRSLSLDPHIILADEPTGSLDKDNGEKLFSLLSSLSKERLVIVVSHDLEIVKRYADIIYVLENKQFREVTNEKETDEKKKPLSIATPPKKNKNVPFSMWLKHAANVLRGKKKRTSLTLMLLIFSLTSFGVSIYMGNDVDKEINGAFSSLVGRNEIVMQKKNQSDSQFGKIISASEDDVIKIIEENQRMFSSYGVSYLVDLDSFFPTKNEFNIKVDDYFHPIKGLSMKSICDYSVIDEAKSLLVYPSMPPMLEDDQIILGLSYEAMANLAYSLGVFRDYRSLGNYLLNHEVFLVFSVENSSWGYSDEEMFRIMGVAESETTSIYHHSHFWNRYVVEVKMRFHPGDENINEKPWDFQQIFYIVPENSYDFVPSLRENEQLSSFVFEKANNIYSPIQCPIGKPCSLSRYYVYIADKKTITHKLIKDVSNEEGVVGYVVGANGSYVSFPDSMMEGFSSRFFISSSLIEVESVAEQISYIEEDKADLEPVLNDKVLQGYYLLPKASSITLSSDFTKLKKGRLPQTNDEICISSSLDKLFSSPSVLYSAALSQERTIGDYIARDYSYNDLKIVGVVEEESKTLFVKPYWPIDFFREKVGVSSFNLEPSSLILNIGQNKDAEKILESLSSKYQMERFINPSETIEKSISSTMNFLKIALLFGSIGCLALSLILLVVISLLTILESDKEGEALFLMGFSRKEVMDSYFASSFSLISISTLISVISMIAVEFFAHMEIGSSLGMNGAFSFSLTPLLCIIGVAFAGLIVTSFVIHQLVKRRDFASKGI